MMSDFPYPLLDLAQSLSTDAPALDFVLPGLVRGTGGSIVAPGATGKSWCALQLAVQIACGFDSLGFGEVQRGKVLLLAAEDPRDVLWGRIRELGRRLDQAQAEDLKENLFLVPCLGEAGDLMDDGTTAERIIQAGRGARLIILDTLSRWHTGEENDRKDAARVMRQIERIAKETGAAVVFLHHVSKSAALNGQGAAQQASRGSSVWVDEARWVAFLQAMTPEEAGECGVGEDERAGFVRWGISKANYCSRPPEIWLKRCAVGMLEQAHMVRGKVSGDVARAGAGKNGKVFVHDYL